MVQFKLSAGPNFADWLHSDQKEYNLFDKVPENQFEQKLNFYPYDFVILSEKSRWVLPNNPI